MILGVASGGSSPAPTTMSASRLRAVSCWRVYIASCSAPMAPPYRRISHALRAARQTVMRPGSRPDPIVPSSVLDIFANRERDRDARQEDDRARVTNILQLTLA